MKEQQDDFSHKIGFNDSQSFSYIWKKLKYSVFDVLFVLLDNSEAQGSMFGLVFQSGVDYLQMLSFPFNSVVVDVWNNNTLNGVTNFFNNFNVSSYMPGIGFNTFLVLLYALIFLIIVVICDIIYVAYSFSKKKFRFTFPLIFMAKIVPLIVSVMFLPIMQTLLNVVNCQSSEDGSFQVLQSFPEVICWEKWHLFHTIVTLIFSFLFVFVSCIVALTIFEPRMTTNSLTARQNSTGQVVFIINKIICQFIFSFSPFQGTLPYCLLLFVLSSWLYYTYNVNQPYYNKNATKFFRICSTYYFWTNLMLLASQLLSSTGFQDGLVIWVCGIIFIGITIIFERKSNIDTLFSSSLKFKSGQQLESHLQYVLNLHHNRNQDKNSYMLLLGYIEKHIQLCLEEDCPLKYNKIRFSTGKQEEQYSCKQLLKQIQRMFIYGIKKYPQCTKLRLTFAFFYMEKYQNNTKAYEQFTKSLATQPSFGQQFIIYRFKKIISEKLQQNKESNQQDLIQIIKFDNHISLCQQGMLISGKLHKQFWIQLKQQSPNLQRLNFIGAHIIETNQMIKYNYKQILTLSNDGSLIIQLQYNYSLYLLFIAHQTKEGKKLLEKVKRKFEICKRKQKRNKISEQQNKMNEILNTKKGLLICQLEFQQNGYEPCCRIRRVNKQFQQLSKFQQEQLIDKRLDKILPKMLEDCHDIKIKQWLEGQQGQRKGQISSSMEINNFPIQDHQQTSKGYIGKNLIGYLKQSTGFIKKVKYQVHFVALQVKFIAQMKNLGGLTQQCVILCDTQGIISEICKSTLFLFPSTSQFLQIQRLLGYGTVETLKKSLTGSIIKSIQGNNNKHYECRMQRMQIFLSNQKHQKILGEQTLKWNNKFEQVKYVGIITSIIQSKASLVGGTSMLKSIGKARKSQKLSQATCFDLKRINLLSQITAMIQDFYSKDQLRQQQSKKKRRNPTRIQKNIKINNFNKYHKYTNQQGTQCSIKMFRYIKGQFIRLYHDGLLEQQSDYDFQQKVTDLQAKLTSEKIQDPDYQNRIKKSLNTFIYHPQVKSIFFKTVGLFSLFLAMNIWIFSEYSTEINRQKLIIKKSQQNFQSLNAVVLGLQQILFLNHLTKQTYKSLQTTKINLEIFNKEVNTIIKGFVSEEKVLPNMDLSNALMIIQANILRYNGFNLTNQPTNFTIFDQQLGQIYFSYITKVIDSLRDVYGTVHLRKNSQFLANSKQYICFITTIIVSFLFVCVWIYETLVIQLKIFQILIWFLDIPFQYISFAEKQCLHFTKNYLQIQKTGQKSLSQLSQCEHYVQQYNHKQKQDKKSKQQQGDCINQNDSKSQNFKARQVLISRYRNISLMGRFNPRQLKKIFLFLFLNSFIISILIVRLYLTSEIAMTKNIFDFYTRQFIQVTTIPLILKLNLQKQNKLINFDQKQAQIMFQNCRQSIMEVRKQKQKVSLYLVSQLNSFSSLIFQKQTSFQYFDLCQYYQNDDQCFLLLQGRLKGGYSSFLVYLMQLQSINITSQQLCNLQKAFRMYISPLMEKMLDEFIEIQVSSVQKIEFIISITFYIYIICISMLFIFPWNLYLRRLNIKINQTFQILNLIPLVLLPVQRPKTREFLKWIILKASQQNSKQQ